MVSSEILINCSLSGGAGFARQSSADCVKGYVPFKKRMTVSLEGVVAG